MFCHGLNTILSDFFFFLNLGLYCVFQICMYVCMYIADQKERGEKMGH